MRDIKEILTFTELRWGSEQRVLYKARIGDCLLRITDDPYPILEVDRVKPGYYRRHLGKRSRHYIYYRIIDSTVSVVRVLYDSMEFAPYLDQGEKTDFQ